MIIPILGRRNAIAYLLWQWLLWGRGAYTAWLDAYFFGASRGFNDYDSLATPYRSSDAKPDKRFSILPTVMRIVGPCEGKDVMDVGCGSGFFTTHIAECGARRVIGLDNSHEQLRLASLHSSHPHVEYLYADVFVDALPKVDVVVAPFVANYARTTPILRHLLQQFHTALVAGGKLVLVVDLPNGRAHQRFGAVKVIEGKVQDGAALSVHLYKDREICVLRATYFTPFTIGRLLREVGFRSISWHKPIVSEEGIRAMNDGFWDGYTDDPELGYITAIK